MSLKIFRGINKVRQPRRFEFKPRYYDEQREDLEFRTKAIERELVPQREHENVLDHGDSRSDLRQQMRREWRRNDSRAADRQSFRRVMLIALVLCAAFMAWLYS